MDIPGNYPTNQANEDFLRKAHGAAQNAGHVFPDYAACEAALESAFGRSKLAREGNNLFGQKQGIYTAKYETLNIPTWEDLNKNGIKDLGEIVDAKWVKFPDWDTCFKERMALLHRLKLYSQALCAGDGESFVREVSKHWSTDPNRASKVLDIHEVHRDLFA